MLVGEGRTRQSVWLTVGDDSRDGDDGVAVVVLVVKRGEEDVLLEVAGGCTLLGRDEGLDRVALAGGDSGGADVAVQRCGGKRRRVEERIDLAEAVVGEEVEEFVLDD